MDKVVVLGADGFIGKHLVHGLARLGKYEIVTFDRFSTRQVGVRHEFEELPNVRIVAGNFFNETDLTNVTQGAKYVFHLISLTTPATSLADPLVDIETNVKGSVELFRICSKNKVSRVLFLSSGGAVYGDIDSEKISEKAVPSPMSPYGIGKLTIEHYLRYFKSQTALDYIVYRVANPYGPGQNVHGKQGVIPIFMHHVLENKSVTVLGDGTMMRDFFYIEDLTKMLANSFDRNHKYSEYNIGSGKGRTVSELVAAIETSTGKSVKVRHAEAPSAFVHKSVLDTSRFSKEFGIKPVVSLEEGLKRTWDYVQQTD